MYTVIDCYDGSTGDSIISRHHTRESAEAACDKLNSRLPKGSLEKYGVSADDATLAADKAEENYEMEQEYNERLSAERDEYDDAVDRIKSGHPAAGDRDLVKYTIRP